MAWGKTIGGLVGTGVGAYYGGPAGAQMGGQVGSMGGGMLGSLFGEEEDGGGDGGAGAQRYMSPQDILNQVTASAPQIGAANVAYNQAMAVPMAKINRDVENVFDPNQGTLREETTSNILDQLRLGGELPPDVEAAVRRAGLQRGVTGGIAGTTAGRNLVGRDIGLTSLDLLNKRIGAAAGYTRSAPTGNQLYQMQTIGMNPSDVGSVAIANQNAQNQAEIYKAQIEAQNSKNMWEAPMSMIGGMFGGGSSVGGPQYGVGAGREYAGPNGSVMSSVKAAPYTGAM